MYHFCSNDMCNAITFRSSISGYSWTRCGNQSRWRRYEF